MSEPADPQPGTWSDHEAVLAFVRERDVACPLCGYNLRNLTAARCPECGNELRMTVGIVHPYLSTWLATFAACAPGAGLGVLCIGITLERGGPSWPRDGGVFVAYWWCLAMLPATVVLLWKRTGFMRLQRRTQLVLAGGSLLLAALMLALVLYTVL